MSYLSTDVSNNEKTQYKGIFVKVLKKVNGSIPVRIGFGFYKPTENDEEFDIELVSTKKFMESKLSTLCSEHKDSAVAKLYGYMLKNVQFNKRIEINKVFKDGKPKTFLEKIIYLIEHGYHEDIPKNGVRFD